jgi:hypothetical protein
VIAEAITYSGFVEQFFFLVPGSFIVCVLFVFVKIMFNKLMSCFSVVQEDKKVTVEDLELKIDKLVKVREAVAHARINCINSTTCRHCSFSK